VFFLPLLLIFVGHPIQLVEVAPSFKTWCDLTKVSRVRVYRAQLDGTYRAILHEKPADGWAAPDWRILTFSITSDDLVSASDGLVPVRVICPIPAGRGSSSRGYASGEIAAKTLRGSFQASLDGGGSVFGFVPRLTLWLLVAQRGGRTLVGKAGAVARGLVFDRLPGLTEAR